MSVLCQFYVSSMAALGQFYVSSMSVVMPHASPPSGFENSRSCRGVICNPVRNANAGSLIANTFAGGPFDQFLPAAHAAIDPNMDKVTPMLEFVRTVHADDYQPTFDYIMNWLTKMVGRREKMKTALLFFGPKGAGKDIIFERLFSRMYGAYYVHKCAKGVDTPFNSEFAGKLFVLWCEIEVTPSNVAAAEGHGQISGLRRTQEGQGH